MWPGYLYFRSSRIRSYVCVAITSATAVTATATITVPGPTDIDTEDMLKSSG